MFWERAFLSEDVYTYSIARQLPKKTENMYEQVIYIYISMIEPDVAQLILFYVFFIFWVGITKQNIFWKMILNDCWGVKQPPQRRPSMSNKPLVIIGG